VNVEVLSRLQFAFTISFHYLFPPLSIGLGVILVIMEGLYLKTGRKMYEDMTRFWIRIFALIFGLGVASGIVMEFEFGTNWATYSRFVGDVFGSALAAEGIFAFALESGFLGVLLFGWNRVGPKVHFFSTVMVALGSIFSAIWIVVANSWQQTPAGYHIVGEGIHARAEITDFWAMVFNPSSVDRLTHVILGAFLAGAFLVMSVHAWYILRNRHVEIAKAGFRIALSVALLAAILQIVSGHRSAEGVSVNQPAKLAAFEGHFDSLAAADLYLLGWVDAQAQQVEGIRVPGGLSLLVHGNPSVPMTGLNAFPEEDRPGLVNLVFQTYHLMVTLGMAMIALCLLAAFLLWRQRLFESPWMMRIFVVAVLMPQLANQLGWYSAEIGRQPWVVYGLLRTSDALSPSVGAGEVLFSLILFGAVYALLFLLFLYLLNRKIQHGPTHNPVEAIPAYSRRKSPLLD
jgi:cytochrome bd ubiquinol oxidase subunit I